MTLGTVKWFSDRKGFGFIEQESGKDVFVHHSVIEGEGFKSLAQGQEVKFDAIDDGKGPRATRVAKHEASTTQAPSRQIGGNRLKWFANVSARKSVLSNAGVPLKGGLD